MVGGPPGSLVGVQNHHESRGFVWKAMASLGRPCRRRESRADNGRAVPTMGESCRRWESCADDGRAVQMCLDGRGAPGRTWCRREGRGAAGMDVASPGWTWHIQNRPNKVR